MKAWIKALRLRTLPLAVSGILAGNAMAYFYGRYDPLIFKLSLYTALLLQILSNLANDYGDFKKGTDNENRVGPERALQSGAIKEADMRMAMTIVGFFALVCGLWLVYVGTQNLDWTSGLFFLVLGVFSIIAAVTYTVGKNAYGYKGLGDLLVFIFFGIVAVSGSFFLQYKELLPQVFMPAAAIGLFSAGVLNMNNMRDIENDKVSGKITIPVRLGLDKARYYHVFLIVSGILSAIVYNVQYGGQYFYFSIIPLAVFIINIAVVLRTKEHKAFDKQLKIVVLGTLLYALSFSLSLIL